MLRSVLCSGNALLLGVAVAPAHAGISQGVMFRNLAYIQTGDGNSTAFDTSFFTLRMTATAANEYTIVQGFNPGPVSPVALGPTDATTYEFNSGVYNSKVAMDTAFPHGAYTITANNPATSDAATTLFNYSADAYPALTPYLSGTSYSAVHGMNPAVPLSVGFSPFVKDATATDPELFFTIIDTATNQSVFDDDFQSASTTGVTIPANTLLPNHEYKYDLDYSDRLTVTSNGADNPALLAFDSRTDAIFTTGNVPEPASAALLAMGAVTLLTSRRR